MRCLTPGSTLVSSDRHAAKRPGKAPAIDPGLPSYAQLAQQPRRYDGRRGDAMARGVPMTIVRNVELLTGLATPREEQGVEIDGLVSLGACFGKQSLSHAIEIGAQADARLLRVAESVDRQDHAAGGQLDQAGKVAHEG